MDKMERLVKIHPAKCHACVSLCNQTSMATKRNQASQDEAKKKQKKADLGSAFKVKSYLNLFEHVLVKNNKDALMDDCKTCFTCREVEDGDNYSLGSTFFIRADEAPACGMEVLAKKIFDLHTNGLEFDPSTSGAEWWTQHIDHRDNIGFHWDRDYGKEEGDEEHVHPYLGTVTYLCVNAGPTVILDKRGTFNYGADISGPLRECIVSHPAPGKHITFDGELLHGAPSDLAFPRVNEDAEGLRVTFLVNIWINHKPVESQRLDAQIASSLKLLVSDVDSLALNSANVEEIPPVAKSEGAVTKHRFGINSGGDDYIIELTLPEDKLTKAEGTVVCLALQDSRIVAGELTESEDDDEEDGDDEDGDED
ncbi:hypothetical protein LEN26_016828 [Aphanomyces euteiches]|nr:hypothetical protein LEN26_016828 [Aphanomyces euteiches]